MPSTIESQTNLSSEELNALYSSNIGLIKHQAAKYLDRGVEFQDLVQYATLGFLEAARRFDSSKDRAFSTYCTIWMDKYLKEATASKGSSLRLTRKDIETRNELAKLYSQMENETSQHDELSALEKAARQLDLPMNEATKLVSSFRPLRSLDAVIKEDSAPLYSSIASDEIAPNDAYTQKELSEQLSLAVDELDPTSSYVIKSVYGLDEEDEKNVYRLSQELGCSCAKVNGIIARALNQLRDRLSPYAI